MNEPRPPEGFVDWLQNMEQEQEQEHAPNWVDKIVENARKLLSKKPDEHKRLIPTLSREDRAREAIKAAQGERVLPAVSNGGRTIEKMKATPVVRVAPTIER